jgi:hypothetical protein
MSLFEFIVGMISVIFALSVAQLLSGVANLLHQGVRVRYFLPHGIWVANLFLLTFLHWWSLWTFRELSWNFGMFFYSLIGPSLMFFACTMLSPRNTMSTDVDLVDHFFGIRKWFLSTFALIMILFGFDGPLFGTEQWLNKLRAVQLLIAALAIWGIFSSNRRVHTSVSLAILLGIVAAVVIRYLPGQYLA